MSSTDLLTPIIPYQPARPTTSDRGMQLNYRTYPKQSKNKVRFCSYESIVAQTILYRWASSDQWVNMPAIDDVHSTLFGDREYVSKRLMGMIMHQTVAYDPKVQKGVTKDTPKSMWCYRFNEKEDLIYGLEWMLTSWIIQMQSKPSVEGVEATLARLKAVDDDELQAIFDKISDSINLGTVKEHDWAQDFKDYRLQTHIAPLPYRKVAPKRSLWQLVKIAQMKGLQPPSAEEIAALSVPDAEAMLIEMINKAPGAKV